MSCASLLFGSEFSEAEIAATRAAKGLLSMEIEVGTACNFQCRYCYVGDDHAQAPGERNELSEAELRNAIMQAQALGARKIIILGGEPMLYRFTLDLCVWMRQHGLVVELFTNGTNMTAPAAAQLFAHKTHVVLKWHSDNLDLQDWLAGVSGGGAVMAEAYRNLRAAGYPTSEARLALSTIICRQNIAELPALWRWMRSENIEPYFEMITPQGRASEDRHGLRPAIAEIRQLFETIQTIDGEEFGRQWQVQPPLLGNRCLRHAFSCLVNAAGDVMPCVGVALPLGNIRRQRLADILRDSEVIADLRDHVHTIQGPCARCEKAHTCYGCRGAAFQLTGNYLGSDPMCWHNQTTDCSALPLPAARLVPHAPPMLMIDALTAVAERRATVSATIRPDNPFCRDGQLAAAAQLELMAQAAAALHGFRTCLRDNGAAADGRLVGTRNFEVFAQIRVGDALTIALRKETSLGAFGVLAAEVWRGDTRTARAELKTWHA